MTQQDSTINDPDEFINFDDSFSRYTEDDTLIFVVFLLPFIIYKSDGKFTFSKSKVNLNHSVANPIPIIVLFGRKKEVEY